MPQSLHRQIVSLLGSLSLLSGLPVAAAEDSTASTPIARVCGPTTANITCVSRYGSLLPPNYDHNPSPINGYTSTSIPSDSSWELVQKAGFVVFDEELAMPILGDNPRIFPRFIPTIPVVHEAPIYHPSTNKLFVTQDGPPGNLTNLVLDLNFDPPTVTAFVTDPIIYQPTGGILHNDKIYWAVHGSTGNGTLENGLAQQAGIARVDPVTLKAEWLANTFYGNRFNGPNDLHVACNGDIYFTDSPYALALNLTPPGQAGLRYATYRFRPETGEITVADNTLQLPNGIAFSRDGKTAYICDSGLEILTPPDQASDAGFYAYPIRIGFESTNNKNIYAFDVEIDEAGASHLTNKRHLWQSIEGIPDGLKVAANDYLLVGGGLAPSVDILDRRGHLIMRIQTNHPVENLAFTGKDLTTLYLTGIGGITKVEMNLPGPDPNNYYL
ncbi:evolved d-pantonohydrolase [Colletotrichum musicola]|uniref:Evolved d-pantonohydrolase n=1 Tax=Colletotrichum musicola TaxID=2175873 RepID=A0A8H6N8Q4_9PEZI|nr:evolved d-pantonohydrolase [Colletotrichum musicola]